MAHSTFYILMCVAATAVCVAAAVKGERPERWAAAVIGCAWLVPVSFPLFLPDRQAGELILLGLDFALAVSLLILSLRFVKLWLGTAMMIQSVELALHGAAMTDAGLGFRPYLVFNNIASIALILILAWATVAAWSGRSAKRRLADRAALGSKVGRDGDAAVA